MKKENLKQIVIKFHDKHYKKILLIPLFMIIFSSIYLYHFYSVNKDIFIKDVSLTGGTSITIYDKNLSIENLTKELSPKLQGLNTRKISDFSTKSQLAIVVETQSDKEVAKSVLEDFLKYNLTEENSSFEFSGASLSQNSYKQMLYALLIAFILMAVVVFLQFKTLIPSLVVIQSAFNDMFFTLIVVNLLGIRISSAGIVAFLMLVGYSVDTDLLLTNKVLKRENKSINKAIFESFSTGIAMTLTSLFAVLIALAVVGQFSYILYQIFLIMALGLFFDMINTWLTNTSIIKWYALYKEKHEN